MTAMKGYNYSTRSGIKTNPYEKNKKIAVIGKKNTFELIDHHHAPSISPRQNHNNFFLGEDIENRL